MVILLPSISRPGRLDLSSDFQWLEHSLQASFSLTGKVHRHLAFGPPFWPKIKALNRTFPRSCVVLACHRRQCFNSPHSHLCRLLSAESWNQAGSRGTLGRSLLGWADACALTRKVAGCLESKMVPPQRHCAS